MASDPVSLLVERVKELHRRYSDDKPATIPTINAAASLIALAPRLAEMVAFINDGVLTHDTADELERLADAALKEIDDG